MSHQDWTTVTIRRTLKKKQASQSLQSSQALQSLQSSQALQSLQSDHKKYAEALDMTYLPKKYVTSESLQALIRKRIELSLNQENADKLCAFPVNTFKRIESKQMIPTPTIQMAVQKKLGVQLKIETTSTF